MCAITAWRRTVDGIECVWLQHDFSFFGGSLGSAEGEKITCGFEYAFERGLPVVLECQSGGARMQEGTLSLMQMAKVSVAVSRHKQKGLPFISVVTDPTYGGVSASYALQGDVRIAVSPRARVGFAGPAVILNTVYGMDQAQYDLECPPGFQSAAWLQGKGQLDIVLDSPSELAGCIGNCLRVLLKLAPATPAVPLETPKPYDGDLTPDYAKARDIRRPQCDDIIAKLFTDFTALVGDGRQAADSCLSSGLAFFQGRAVVVIGNGKGHTPDDMGAR